MMQNEFKVPAIIADAVRTARLPENYETAKRAIAECDRIDECAGWADIVAAIASYARQYEDPELENYCRRIRARAARRMGQLLKEFDARGGDRRKNQPPPNFAPPSRSQAAEEAGTRRNPPFSESVRLGLWRVCGES